jgi:hypothetical protein
MKGIKTKLSKVGDPFSSGRNIRKSNEECTCMHQIQSNHRQASNAKSNGKARKIAAHQQPD